jgi:hypothetical protein
MCGITDSCSDCDWELVAVGKPSCVLSPSVCTILCALLDCADTPSKE